MKSLLYLALIGSMLAARNPQEATVRTAAGSVTVTPGAGNSVTVSRSGDAADPAASGTAVFNEKGYSVHVDRRTGAVAFIATDGDTLLYEKAPFRFAAQSGTGFYGAGERGQSLRLNGDSLVNWNRPNYGYGEGDPRLSQMNITMPYLLTDRGYALLFNDPGRSLIAFDGNNTGSSAITYTTETVRPVSYTFIGGGDMPSVTSNFTRVTGRQDLPPFWALGYITSKYGYHTDREALGAVDSLKRNGFPVDGLIFDLYWYGTETDMGRLEWNPVQFPDPKGMLDSLRRQGVNTVLIHQPFINKKGAIDNYNLLRANGMLTVDSAGNVVDPVLWIGESGMFDIANPKTRRWLWNRLDSITRDGVAGWWGDLGEPEQHPLNIRHANGDRALDFHNVYGNEWSKLIYEGLRRDYPAMRPFLLMRGGSTGLQKYSVFPWTGDVARSWEGLQPQIKLMLNSGLSGLGYMSSDIGGFAVNNDAPTDPELYVRWLQMGVFNPILRTHAQFAPEPYHYPEQMPQLRDLIRMRYQWLPYNYTLAFHNSAEGQPLARPLNYYGDPKGRLSDVEDEYLWGDEVLVAPVMKKGATSRQVVFPDLDRADKPTVWIDWFDTTKRYNGGTTDTVAAPLATFPLFVRAGSFIPQYTRKIENVTEYDPRYLTVKYFPADRASSYKLYDDDRVSPTSLADGAYTLTDFSTDGKGNIRISRTGSWKGMPAVRHIDLQIVGTDARKATVNGKRVKARYDAATRTLSIPVDFSGAPLLVRF